MNKPKLLIYLVIAIILIIGIYERQTGNLVGAIYYSRTRPFHATVPGNMLILLSLLLFVVVSYVMRKK